MTDLRDASDPESTDSADSTEIPIENWEEIVAGLERFAGEDGAISTTEEKASCEVGSARFEIRRNGVVSAGMPLHEVAGVQARVLRFDHANGAITVVGGENGGDREDEAETERFEYTFRRP